MVSAAAAVLLATVAAVRPPGAEAAVPTCWDDRVPVALAPGLPAAQAVAVRLCVPGDDTPDLVQLLVPGATYNSSYWDFPVKRNSYVDFMNAHGRATITFERLNTGRSDSVPAPLVTTPDDAYTLHQVVQRLRHDGVAGHRFATVVTVGHSLGSINATDEAALFHDVDGVVVSGFTHFPAPDLVTGLAANRLVEPAPGQPGEVQPKPGARAEYFYGPSGADPDVLAADEAIPDTITLGELATFPTGMAGVQSDLITAPVLLAEGSGERIFHCAVGPCATAEEVALVEGPRYAAARSVTPFVLAGSGHDLNLAPNAPEFFARALQWIDETVSFRRV
ncbi:alpha/beta fold hydrolase [Amycolatopsis thermophila]|uniref:AB hydrolase-1 domain-containing protein n=1 Tax=Amycolatopsis thermophila TaxID=206084 RepID=A0ABU0F534_9PSEU|nr:alpha/beta fold hydrolase [Amycolatopsis thermophila]MDQ0382694.1 hypothetical protein [Amycolatopsis thermophila]